MTKFKELFTKYYLTLLGAIILIVYIWNRFLRTRTVKTIPYEYLSTISFFLLIYICSIFAFILFTLIFSSKKNANLEILIDWIFTPIKELEIFIRHHIIGKGNYERFISFVYPCLNFVIIKTNLFYIIFWVFPRLILLTALFIDVFVFHQMNYKYQVILFGLLLFFNRYFKYSLKNIKEENIEYLKMYVDTITTKYVPYIHPSELEPGYNIEDDDDFFPPTMSLPLEIFIKFKTESLVYEGIIREFTYVRKTLKALDEFWDKYVGSKFIIFINKPVPLDYKNKFGDKAPENYKKAHNIVDKALEEFFEKEFNKIMNISFLIEHLNKISNSDKSIRYLKVLIYLLYLICWLYVLIISLPNLDTKDLFEVLTETYKQIPNYFIEIQMYDEN